MTKVRNTAGKFAAKSDVPRRVRSVNLTDNAWQWLAQTAEQAGISRNDYLEALADGSPIMETVQATSSPIMETVQATSSPIMETAQAETKNIDKQRNSKALPIMETAQAESESHKQAEITELRRQLENADRLLVRKNQELQAMGGVLAATNQKVFDRDAEIERLESELANRPEQNSAPIAIELLEPPDPIEVTNKLNALLTGKTRRLAVKDVAKVLNG